MQLTDTVRALAQTQIQAAPMQAGAMPPKAASQSLASRIPPDEKEARRELRQAGSVHSLNLRSQRMEGRQYPDDEREVRPTDRRMEVNPNRIVIEKFIKEAGDADTGAKGMPQPG